MSKYTSENTHILATHMQPGNNRRMLLLHIMDDGHHEYIIGSYFTATPNGTGEPLDYSWDWGHYFFDVMSAVDYWKREVLEA